MRFSVTGEHRIGGKLLDASHPRYYPEVWKHVGDVVARLRLGGDDEFTTGGAHGVDELAAASAYTFYSWGRVPLLRVCIPQGEVYCETTPRYAHLVERVNGGYMARNERLVEHADVLLAFPLTSQEELRSGTWATVRRARDKGIEIRYFPIEGHPWIEKATT